MPDNSDKSILKLSNVTKCQFGALDLVTCHKDIEPTLKSSYNQYLKYKSLLSAIVITSDYCPIKVNQGSSEVT